MAQNYKEILAGRDYQFSATVDAWVQQANERLLAVVRMSIQDVIDDAQMTVSKGGRMRVDTGFLRASGRISFNGMPSGPVRPAEGGGTNWSPVVTEVELAKAQIGSTIFFGWTAHYAIYREAYDGFLYGAVQKWQAIVTRNVNALKARAQFK